MFQFAEDKTVLLEDYGKFWRVCCCRGGGGGDGGCSEPRRSYESLLGHKKKSSGINFFFPLCFVSDVTCSRRRGQTINNHISRRPITRDTLVYDDFAKGMGRSFYSMMKRRRRQERFPNFKGGI